MSVMGIILVVACVTCLAVATVWMIVEMVGTIKDRRNEK